jgi:diphthine-ammonia ligase
MKNIKDALFACSWSGGKDSCMAFYYAVQNGGVPLSLLTMCIENGNRTRSHGLAPGIIHAQAASLSISMTTVNTSWDNYEENFINTLKDLKVSRGIDSAVFGDIDLQEHKDWEDKVCKKAEVTPFLPLWKMDRELILKEFLNVGFKAVIVAVNEKCLDKSFLGRELDYGIISEFKKLNVDPCGENGEYHTVVIDGPLFSKPIELEKGNISKHPGYSFLDF